MNTHKPTKRFFFLLFFFCLFFSGAGIGWTEPIDSLAVKDVYLVRGELEALRVYSLTRVSLVDPDIADIADATENEILLNAQFPGETTLFIWDEYGKRKLNIHVFDKDLELIKQRLETLLAMVEIKGVTVTINKEQGKVVLVGGVPDYKSAQFDEIILPFTDHIIRLTESAAAEDMVRIDLQVTELNDTLLKSLGIDWSTGGVTGIAPRYQETVPTFDGTVNDFFQIGDFRRSGQLIAAVNALVTEGKARVLSNPKLVVVSGEEASFLVGGEIPIRTTTVTEGSTQENISFREYGISMSVTPTIKQGKIDVLVDFEVSDIDSANAVGTNVAFTTRTAQTHLLLDNGQTVVLAGLIKQSESENVSKVPFVGDIPIIGMFFRSRRNPAANQDQEVVISLTPFILDHNQVGSTQGFSKISRADLAEYLSGYVIDQGMKDSSGAVKGPMADKGLNEDMKEYIQSIQKRIAKGTVYPKEAEVSGWEGTVKVSLLLLSDGTLANASIKESSGNEIFDEAALKTARKAAPYAHFPSSTDIQQLTVTIPIVYTLKK